MYCQPAYRVSAPPASRPTVAPVAPMPPQALSALLRSAPSLNMFSTMDSAAGSTTAAPRPWMPRMMIWKVSPVASAQASEAAVKTASPAVNRRLRPSRSAARPPNSRNPPKVSAYVGHPADAIDCPHRVHCTTSRPAGHGLRSAGHIAEDHRPVLQPPLVGEPEVEPGGIHVLEQPLPCADHDGYDPELELVDQVVPQE